MIQGKSLVKVFTVLSKRQPLSSVSNNCNIGWGKYGWWPVALNWSSKNDGSPKVCGSNSDSAQEELFCAVNTSPLSDLCCSIVGWYILSVDLCSGIITFASSNFCDNKIFIIKIAIENMIQCHAQPPHSASTISLFVSTQCDWVGTLFGWLQ